MSEKAGPRKRLSKLIVDSAEPREKEYVYGVASCLALAAEFAQQAQSLSSHNTVSAGATVRYGKSPSANMAN